MYIIKQKFKDFLKMRGPFRIIIIAITVSMLLIFILLTSVIVLRSVFNITTSNAVLYFTKNEKGNMEITNDLDFNQAQKVLFMIDASCLFDLIESIVSATSKEPLMELTWNDGRGILKEFRPDGTKFIAVFSRYKENESNPQGLFIGGDLPFGDFDRWMERDRNNTGIAFYDGNRWYHIWCNLNEAINIRTDKRNIMIEPWQWRFLDFRKLKYSSDEIILESSHEFYDHSPDGNLHIFMRRLIQKRLNSDYLILKVEFINRGTEPFVYNYSIGDEPWVGDFGDSGGDIGWTNNRVFKREGYIFPWRHSFAGIWDIGNDLINEGHNFTGYANFVEWLENPPTIVYFSNDFIEVDETRPLNSKDQRIINLVWLNQSLMSKESRSYTLAFGVARPDRFTGLPVKPEVNFSEGGS